MKEPDKNGDAVNANVANTIATDGSSTNEPTEPDAEDAAPMVTLVDETDAPPEVIMPPPCYFWNVCTQRAATEKAGRAVCSNCATNLNGFEYPLRSPARAPLYKSGRDVAEAMNIID